MKKRFFALLFFLSAFFLVLICNSNRYASASEISSNKAIDSFGNCEIYDQKNISKAKNIAINTNKSTQTSSNENFFSQVATDKEYIDTYEYIIENVNELLNGLDLTGLDEEFSDFEFFQGKGGASERIVDLISGDYKLSAVDIIKNLFNELWLNVGDLTAYFAIIVAVSLLLAIVNAIKPSFMDKSLHNLMFFVCFTVIIGVVAGVYSNVYESTINCSNSLEKQSEVVFPIILTLMTASGGQSSVAVFQPQVAFLVKVMSYVVRGVLLPITLLILLFNIIGALNPNYSMDKGKQFLKSAFKWITGIIVVVFNFFVTAQGITSSIYDGVSIKALKYALGNSIPLVGNLVSGGFDVCLASLVLIKNAVGGFAMVALVFQIIKPIIKIGALTLFLRFVAAVIEPLADKRIVGFLSGVADTTGYLTASIAVGASSYFITLLLMVCSLKGAV